jgi:hypothetical protein
MTTPKTITPFIEPLAALHRLLGRFGEQGVVIGGIASSLLGQPRLTADIDAVLLLSTDELPLLIKAALEEGFELRLPDAEAFARRTRVLLLRHLASGINVDISLGVLPFEVEAVERSQLQKAGGISIRLPTPEDLIIFKAVAHRPKDLLDIQAIIRSQPNLDRKRIRYWVQEFAKALDMPELWDDIAGWL